MTILIHLITQWSYGFLLLIIYLYYNISNSFTEHYAHKTPEGNTEWLGST